MNEKVEAQNGTVIETLLAVSVDLWQGEARFNLNQFRSRLP